MWLACSHPASLRPSEFRAGAAAASGSAALVVPLSLGIEGPEWISFYHRHSRNASGAGAFACELLGALVAGLLLESQPAAVGIQNAGGIALHDKLSVIQPNSALAHLQDVAGRMRHEQNGFARALKI